MRVLNVAEKPSMAKQISSILAGDELDSVLSVEHCLIYIRSNLVRTSIVEISSFRTNSVGILQQWS